MTIPLLQPAQYPPSAILPNTEYFEIQSEIAGQRYAVWVNLPPRYDSEGDRRYPAIFTPDGNLFVPLFIPFNGLLRDDPIYPIQPFVQVSVGYCGADIADWITRGRNRDLLPPNEPASPAHLAGFEAAVAAGIWTAEMGESFRASVINGGRADLYLRFLAEELYPRITERWRIDAASTGLFGDSYSGLFSAWVALQRHPLFTRIGAASPGMATRESKVFKLLKQEVANGADHSGRRLHMTICEGEMTVASPYQMLGASYAEFTYQLGLAPLKGLTFTSAVIPTESHLTGATPSWFSFLRACYSGT